MNTIKTLNDVRKLVKKHCSGPLAWLGKRGLDAVGIKEIAGFLPLIFCADSGTDVNLFSKETAVFAIENAKPIREDWSTTHLGEFLMQDQFRHLLKMLNGRLTILPYQTNELIEEISTSNNWQLLANPMQVKNKLEDKMHFMELLKHLNLNVVPHVVIENIATQTYESIRYLIGHNKFVVQYPSVSSGKGTFLVTNKESLVEATHFAAEKGTMVRVAAFMEGTSPNVNVVSTKNGSIIAPYSHQIVGVESIRKGFGSYCGNQWIHDSDPNISKSLYAQAIAFGNYLYDQIGYKGIFGLDFVGKYPIEINARVNGGTQTLTQILLSRGYIPPMAFHILEMLGVEYTFDVDAYNKSVQSLMIERFHVSMHNNSKSAVRVNGNVHAGVYKITNNKLEFVRHGYHVEHAKRIGEFVLNCGVPRQGLILVPGAAIVKIQGPGIIYEPNNGTLTKWGESVINIVNTAFNLEEINISKEIK